MAIYKRAGSPYYYYSFECGGFKFQGSTRKTSKREAREEERQQRERARDEVKARHGVVAALKGKSPLTLQVAFTKWWNEKAQHRADADAIFASAERMLEHFGLDKRLDEITDADIAAWVARRRGERVWGKNKFKDGRPAPLVTPARVNRSTVDLLRAIYGYAWRSLKLRYANEPNWGQHRLPEPEERVRELEPEEQSALTEAAHPDYERVYRFARLSGLRLTTCLLRKENVKLGLGRIEIKGKRGKINRVPITPAIRSLLMECWADHPEWVFTYSAARTRDGRVEGSRYPITRSGLISAWRRDRKRAIKQAPSLGTFRYHDNRHTAATRLLRTTGNLKMVQRLLNHSRIATTAKYAHVVDGELAAAMAKVEDGDTGSLQQVPTVKAKSSRSA